MSETKTVFEKSGGAFLRPKSVGSSVHWYVYIDEYVVDYGKRKGQTRVTIHSELRLSDCDDWINWHVGADITNLEKIDRAIEQLTAFKQAMTEAHTVMAARNEALGVKTEEDDDL